MTMSTTVHVEGISSQTTKDEVRDFFSFCGKISNLSITPTSGDEKASKSATVTFEKETAAKTALLLDNTQLGPAQVQVKPAASLDDLGHRGEGEEHEVQQEDKPRSRIIAEYLAHGYVISDKIIERAIALDQQHGVSARFSKTLKDFDGRYKATDKARATDNKFGMTRSATMAWNSVHSYFDKAINTPTGQKLRKFYEEGNKQVVDVHNEARHLANLKSGKPTNGNGSGAEASVPAASVPVTDAGAVSSGAPPAVVADPEKEVVTGTEKTG